MTETLLPIQPDVLRHNLSVITGSEPPFIPSSYVVFDLETTDTEPSKGWIWQIGMYPVLDGVTQCDAVKGVTLHCGLEDWQLKKASFEISRRRANNLGVEFDRRATPKRDSAYEDAERGFIEQVRAGSVSPKEALQSMVDVLQAYVSDGRYLVGQNVANFDIRFIEAECKRYDIPFRFPQGNLLDTGMLIKAGVLGRRIAPNETPRAFYARISSQRARGVYYALERYCIPYWNMDVRYGINVAEAHDAGYDCMLTAKVLECLFEEANLRNTRESVVAGDDES